jgi:hypothetical protein
MVLIIVRKLLVALTVFAFVAGTTMQATPSAAAPGMPVDSEADAGCPYMAMQQKGTGKQQPVPRY